MIASANCRASARSGFDVSTPHQVGVGGVGEAARDRLVEAGAHPEEALGRPLAGAERTVALVDVSGQQGGRLRVGACDDEGGNVGHVSGQSGRCQRPHVLCRRDEDLAAEVTALLLRRQLVLPVHAGGTGLDHRPHQLVRVERATEARLGVGDDRQQVVDGRVASRASLSDQAIWSARSSALLIRRTTAGTEFTG